MDLFKILFTAPELGDSIVFKRGEQETRAAILDITTNHGGTIRRVVNTAKAGCAQDVTREFVKVPPTLYRVAEQSDGSLVMVAPMATLARFLELHPDAVRRIERETEDGGACRIFKDRASLKYALVVTLDLDEVTP